jgi:type II restriction enzyme
MKKYINPDKCPTYRKKSQHIQELVNTALYILDVFGMPMNRTNRMLEKTAITFLACGNIKEVKDLKSINDLSSGFALGTKEIIDFVNKYYNENISRGSYDYIKRDALDYLMPAKIVLQSSPNSATNDSTRGYSINPFYAELVKEFGEKGWEQKVQNRLKEIQPLNQKLKRERELKKVKVTLPSGGKIQFSTGEHNGLQKAIIEDFLSRYGFGAQVLYVGDTSDKYLHLEEKKLQELNFFQISHEELPDVIAYSEEKNWLYLIEAVHSSGPISEIRLLQLQKLTEKCTADIVYVTAFLNRQKFRQFMAEIAWETEVWIADNPDHMIHFNGDKFLGPYSG